MGTGKPSIENGWMATRTQFLFSFILLPLILAFFFFLILSILILCTFISVKASVSSTEWASKQFFLKDYNSSNGLVNVRRSCVDTQPPVLYRGLTESHLQTVLPVIGN